MSRRSSSRRRSTTEDVFPSLPEGVQNGLRRLVSDNSNTIAKMLDCDINTSNNSEDAIILLCEQCALVMKQQLSPSSFLARFFDVTVLSEHALLLQKSGKGSVATLADRIGTAWAKNAPFIVVDGVEATEEEKGEKSNKIKNNAADDDANAAENTKKKKSASSSSPKRKKSLQDNYDDEATASNKEAKKAKQATAAANNKG